MDISARLIQEQVVVEGCAHHVLPGAVAVRDGPVSDRGIDATNHISRGEEVGVGGSVVDPLGFEGQLQAVQGAVIACLRCRKCRRGVCVTAGADRAAAGDKGVVFARHVADDAGTFLVGAGADSLVRAEGVVDLPVVLITAQVVEGAGGGQVVGSDEAADAGSARVVLDAVARFTAAVAAGAECGGAIDVITHVAVRYVDGECLGGPAQCAGAGVGVAGGAVEDLASLEDISRLINVGTAVLIVQLGDESGAGMAARTGSAAGGAPVEVHPGFTSRIAVGGPGELY